MSLTKIVITAPKVKFPAGVKLGLDTRWATNHAAYVKQLSPGLYEVVTPVAFPKGAVLWAEDPDKNLGKVKNDRGTDIIPFDVVEMPAGYLEEKPEDAAKRAAFLKPRKA